jgi:hypothetical protein
MHLLCVGGRSALRWWRALLLGSAAAVLAAAVPAAPVLAGAAGTPPVMLVTAKAAAPAVPMVTGGQVGATPGARNAAVLPSAERSGRGFFSYTSNGDRYLVPVPAVPFVGRQLSWSLFDVSALARDHITGTARIPVSLSFSPGATPAAPPGVRLTSVSGNSARGYMTASSGRNFAAWLRHRIGADIRAGRQAGATLLPGGLVTMSLAAPAPVPGRGISAAGPLHIVQFNATDLNGQPAGSPIVVLVNMDSLSRANEDEVPLENGIARVALPAGHYAVLTLFLDFDTLGNNIADRWVTPSFTVPAASGATTTVTLDERASTSQISAQTPRPAGEAFAATTFSPIDSAHNAGGLIGITQVGPANPFGAPPTSLYVAPEPAAPAGTLRYDVEWQGVPPGTSPAYRYDVAFGSDDVPADETYTVRSSQLATVQQHFSVDPAASPGTFTNQMLTVPLDPVSGQSIFGDDFPVPAPGNVTDYFGTADGGQWLQQTVMDNFELDEAADDHIFAAGHVYSLQWGHGPLAPGFGQHTGPHQVFNSPGGLVPCPACIGTGGTLALIFSDYAGDSEPDHVGSSFAPANFALYQDGTQLVNAANTIGAVLTGVPQTSSTYRAVLDVDGTGAFSQSTVTHTDLTFQYTPGAQPGSALPSDDACYPLTAGGAPTGPCQILPVLTLNYQLATSETDTSSAPVQHLRLTVGHLTYDGHGSHAPITSATVAVSFDGGTTWQPAVVGGHDGHYKVTWKNPAAAAGTSPDLRVTATDAAGGSITQTITNAYTIAAG